MDNNRILSILLLVAVAIYVVCPADLVPGPVDDVILMLLYALTNRNTNTNRSFAE